MISAVLLSVALAAVAQDSAHVVLVATTDVHGRATSWNYFSNTPHPGGLARAATAVDSLRRAYAGQVVLVDAGDVIQGDPFAEYFARISPRDPNPIIDAMNLMAYDAATLGNHDFDFGVAVLERALTGAAFPYVSANVVFGAGFELPATVVVERGGVRVAITGFTTPGVAVWNRRFLQGRVTVAPIGEVAETALTGARQQADVSVAVIHSGLRGASAYDTTGVGPEHVAGDLAKLTHPPDVVVVGHSHRELIDSVIDGVLFVQPRPYAETLAVVHIGLVRGRSGWRINRLHGDRVELGRVEPDPRVERRLENDHQVVYTWVTSPVGQATADMPATLSRVTPTAVMNVLHEAQKQRTGAQLSAAAAFDLNAGFRAGPIRLGDIAALYPYENSLRAVSLTGEQLRAYLEHSVRYFEVSATGVRTSDTIPGYNYDMVSGVQYRIDLSKPAGDRIVGLSVDGVPVMADDRFTMALNSYRQSGGGRYTMLAGAPVVYDRGESVRDVLADAVRSRGTIDPAEYAEDNWSITPAAAAATLRTEFLQRTDSTSVEQPILRIVSFNDLDGALRTEAGQPTAARLSAAMDSAAADCQCPTLRLSAGGQLSGTPLADMGHGRAVIEVLNLFALDAATLGATDLSWARDTLEHRAAEATFPWAVTNVFDRAAGARPVWMRSAVIVDAGGHRVAVLGYLSPGIAARARVDGLATLDVRPALETIGPVVERERERGADLVVLLAQAGSGCTVQGCDEELFQLAHEMSGLVDVIVAGGDGVALDTVVAGIPVVQAPGQGRGLGVVDLLQSDEGTPWRAAVAPGGPGVTPDTAVAAVVARYAAEVDSILARVVARVRLPMPKERRPSTLSRLVADAFRNVGRANLGLVPLDMIGEGLAAGPVLYGELFQVLPLRRQVTVVTMTGSDFRAAVERGVAGTVPVIDVSGVTVRYDLSRDPGKRVRQMRLLDGREIQEKDKYTVALPNVFTRGPDAVSVSSRDYSLGLDVDVLASYLRRLAQPVEPPRGSRLEATD